MITDDAESQRNTDQKQFDVDSCYSTDEERNGSRKRPEVDIREM